MVSLILPTILLQVASSSFNHFRGTKYAKDNLEKQMKLEKEITTNGIAKAWQQYKDLRDLQKSIALASHRERLISIEESLKHTLMMEAYRESLKNWPLLVPPFVMKRDSLSLLVDEEISDNITLPIHCILTPSTNASFNKVVFSEFEQIFSEFISKYWAVNSKQKIIFYQSCWKSENSDCGSLYKNINTQLSNVPCIIISPEESKDGWRFRFHMWFNENEILENNILTPTKELKYAPGHVYTEEDKENIISNLMPLLQLNISCLADSYYWQYYSLPPKLPKLIREHNFSFDKKEEFNLIKDSYKSYLFPGDNESLSNFNKSIKDILEYTKSVSEMVNNEEMNCMLSQKLRYFANDPHKQYSSVIEMIHTGDLLMQLTREESTLLTNITKKLI